MPQLRVVSWNAEGMFVTGTKTRRATPQDALRVLKDLNADVVVIPEFGLKDSLLKETLAEIEHLSYTCILTAYEDKRAPGLYFGILSRLPISHHKTFQLEGSTRRATIIECLVPGQNKPLRVVGVHLDDRNEALRMRQITSVVETVNDRTEAPLLVLGDFNAMSRQSLFANLMRSTPIHLFTKIIPHQKLRSVFERVSEMAIGTTINYLFQHTNLHSLDPILQRTISAKQADVDWMPSWRIAKIDWIFGNQFITTRSYRVMRDVGSDHRPVIADISINLHNNDGA